VNDVRTLSSYLESELNIREIVFTTDEAATNVKYRAGADWPVLGKKLRKDMAKVKNGLPKLTSEEVKKYVQTGSVSVEGIPLVEGDLTVTRYIDLPADSTLATNTDNDVVVLLDIKIYPELEGEGLARELINRTQKLRKKAGLKATDDVEIFYNIVRETPGGEKLEAALKENADVIRRTVRALPVQQSLRKPDAEVLIEEDQEIGETKFTLSLVKV
jgi:isoleucyl-tRNA synthetase